MAQMDVSFCVRQALPFLEHCPEGLRAAAELLHSEPLSLMDLSLRELSDGDREALVDAIAAACLDCALTVPLAVMVPQLNAEPGRPADRSKTRLANVLGKQDVQTWQQLGAITLQDVSAWRNIGIGSVRELFMIVISIGLGPSDSAIGGKASPTREDESTSAFVRNWRLIAAWASGDRSAETVGEALALLQSADLPPEIAGAWSLLSGTQLVLLAGDTRNRYDVGGAVEMLLASLDERQRLLLLARTLRLTARATLRELEALLGLSFERIRQLESSTAAQLRAQANSRESPIAQAVARMRVELGAAAPLAEVARDNRVEADDIDGRDPPRTRLGIQLLLLLWLAGPYEKRDQWLVLSPGQRVVDATVQALQDATRAGPIRVETATTFVASVGIRRIWARRWLRTATGFRVLGGHLVRWSGTLADKMAALLELKDAPMSKAELREALAEEGTPGTLANYLRVDARFIRTGLDTFALREWGGEQYSGVVGEMIEEIERKGGSASREELTQAVTRFGASPNSVAIYLSGLLFAPVGRDRYRLKTIEELSAVQPGPVTLAKDCFLLEEGWAIRHLVSGDTVRGSGLGVPTGFAEVVNVTGARRQAVFPSAFGDITFFLSDHATLKVSSLRRAVQALACEIDDFVFLECCGDSIRFHRKSRMLLESLEVDERAASEIGTTIARWQGDLERAFWHGLGFDDNTRSDRRTIRARLRARNETDLLYLFDGSRAIERRKGPAPTLSEPEVER